MKSLLLKILVRALFVLRSVTTRSTAIPHDFGVILFVELTSLGEVIVMLPAIRAIRLRFPGARISVAVRQDLAELFQCVAAVDHVYGVPEPSSFRGFLRGVGRLRGSAFDLVCSMSPSGRNALLTLLVRADRRIGFFETPDVDATFLHRSVVRGIGLPKPPGDVFHIENISGRARKVMNAVGVEVPEGGGVLLDTLPVAVGSTPPSRTGGAPKPRLLVIHPFARWEYRQWPWRRFAELARGLGTDDAIECLFVGRTQEWERTGGFRDAIATFPHVRILETDSIGEVIRVLTQASMFVGNDSGLLHLASALGLPVVGVFGPASPSLTAPRGGKGIFLYKNVECSPCPQRVCVRPEYPCVELISVEEVRSAVSRLWKMIDAEAKSGRA